MRLSGIVAVCGLLLAGIGFAAPAAADTIVYDFEDLAATGTSGAYTSLSMTVSGVTLTLSRSSGAAFDITDVGGRPGGWGGRSLDPFSSLPPGDRWVATFSTEVTSLHLEFGDFGGDDDGPVASAVWDGPDLRGNQGQGGSFAFPSFGSTNYAGTGLTLDYAEFGSGGSSPNSLYWDNIKVTTATTAAPPVPEPATLVLVGLGALEFARRRARRLARP
jgi:hypothetical protein